MKFREAKQIHAKYYQEFLADLEQSSKDSEISSISVANILDREWFQIIAAQHWVTQDCLVYEENSDLCLDFPVQAYNILSLRLYGDSWLEWIQPALMVAEKQQNISSIAILMYLVGNVKLYAFDLNSAEEQFLRSLRFSENYDDLEIQSRAFIGLAQIYYLQKRDWNEPLEKAWERAEAVENKRMLTAVHLLRGQASSNDKLQYFEKAWEYARQSGDLPTIVNTLIQLGSIKQTPFKSYLRQGYLERAYKLSTLINLKPQTLLSLISLADYCEHEANDYLQAQRFLVRAAKLASDLGRKDLECTCLLKLSPFWRMFGNSERALEYSCKALTLGQDLKSKEVVWTAIVESLTSLIMIGDPIRIDLFMQQIRENEIILLLLESELRKLDERIKLAWRSAIVLRPIIRIFRPLFAGFLQLINRRNSDRFAGIVGQNNIIAQSYINNEEKYRKLNQSEESLKKARSLKDQNLLVRSLLEFGKSNEIIGLFDRAVIAYEEALRETVISSSHESLIDSLSAICKFHLYQDNAELVLTILQKHAWRLYYNDQGMDLNLLIISIDALNRLGKFMVAKREIERLLAISRSIKNQKIECQLLTRLAVTSYALSYFDLAEQALRSAYQISEHINDNVLIAECSYFAGVTYGRLGKYSEANSYFQKAIVIYENLGDRWSEGMSLLGSATNLISLLDKERARENFVRAGEIFADLGLSPPRASRLYSLTFLPLWMIRITDFFDRLFIRALLLVVRILIYFKVLD